MALFLFRRGGICELLVPVELQSGRRQDLRDIGVVQGEGSLIGLDLAEDQGDDAQHDEDDPVERVREDDLEGHV